MKYLFLKFENAGFFKDQRWTKDRVYYTDENKNLVNSRRVDFIQYVEPITVNHISNALHVLMGERPKASLRKTSIERIEDIFRLANDGYLKITTPLITDERGDYYPTETITVRKSVYNSFQKMFHITKELVKRLLGDDLNTQLFALLDKLFDQNVSEKYTMIEIIDIVNEKHVNNIEFIEFIDLLRAGGKTPLINHFKMSTWDKLSSLLGKELYDEFIVLLNDIFSENVVEKYYSSDIIIRLNRDYFNDPRFLAFISRLSKMKLDKAKNAITGTTTDTIFNKNSRTLRTVNSDVQQITKIDGEIIIRIEDEHIDKYLDKLRNGSGFARILDGGLLWIDKILDEDSVTENMFDKFIEIKTISTKTKKCKE